MNGKEFNHGREIEHNLFKDYQWVTENVENPTPLSNILTNISNDMVTGVCGFGVAKDSKLCYAFDINDDGTAEYLGMWKC